MCYDRIKKGLQPACVAACPSGALNFGTEQEMLGLAEKRARELKAAGANHAQIYGQGNRVIYVLLSEPANYKIEQEPLLSPDVYTPVEVLLRECEGLNK
jgi:formate dehydrogenase iron-sulfur subunit